MPSKIPTYSVYPNNSPDTDYEQDYETPAPGPPPTRSGHQNLDEDKDKIPNSLSRIRLARVYQFIFFLQTTWSWNGHSPSEPSSSLHSASLWLPVQVTCCISTSVHLILERFFLKIFWGQQHKLDAQGSSSHLQGPGDKPSLTFGHKDDPLEKLTKKPQN